jgi:hypothetical protein
LFRVREGASVADEREQALHYAARLRGLTLVRSGEKYALVHYVLNDTSLDEIAAFLASENSDERRAADGDRRADLRAMLKAERALLVEMEQATREAGEPGRDHAATEAALAEIRRRIGEIQGEMERKGSS